MISRTLHVLFASVIILTACSHGIETASEFDRKADFSGLRTYAWAQEDSSGSERGTDRYQFVDKEVRSAVNRELAAKGFKASTGTPDFVVNYYVWLETKLVDDPYSGLARWDRTMGPYGRMRHPVYDRSQMSPREYDEGTLIITIGDPRTEREIWRGTATALIKQGDSQEQRRTRIERAVKDILAKFPPTTK